MKWSGGRNGAGWHVNPVRPYQGHTYCMAILAAHDLLYQLLLTMYPDYLLGAARCRPGLPHAEVTRPPGDPAPPPLETVKNRDSRRGSTQSSDTVRFSECVRPAARSAPAVSFSRWDFRFGFSFQSMHVILRNAARICGFLFSFSFSLARPETGGGVADRPDSHGRPRRPPRGRPGVGPN